MIYTALVRQGYVHMNVIMSTSNPTAFELSCAIKGEQSRAILSLLGLLAKIWFLLSQGPAVGRTQVLPRCGPENAWGTVQFSAAPWQFLPRVS